MSGLRTRSDSSWASSSITAYDHGSVTTFPSNTYGSEKSITEYCTTGWREIIRQGGVIVSEMQRSRTQRDVPLGDHFPITYGKYGIDVEYVGDFYGLILNAGGAPSVNPLTNALNSLRSQAMTEALSKAGETEMCIAETVRDLNDTIGMLLSPLKSASKLLGKIAKKSQRLARKHPNRHRSQNISDAWLQYRYGWQPLMMDIETIMTMSNSLSTKCQSRRLVLRGSKTVAGTSEQPFTNKRLPGYFDFILADGKWQLTDSQTANAGVIVDIEPMSPLEAIETIFGFRTRDVPSSLWALTPFSFVADWFVNVEEWLQAVMPNPRVHPRASWVTTVARRRRYIIDARLHTDPTKTWNVTFEATLGKDLYIKELVERIPNPSLTPTLQMNSESLSMLRNIDAVALAVKPLNGLFAALRH